MRLLILALFTLLLTSCATSHKYMSRVELPVGTYQHIETVIKYNLNKEWATIGDEKYKIESYEYIYPRYLIFKSKKDRRGIMINLEDCSRIKIIYNHNARIHFHSQDAFYQSQDIFYQYE